MFVPDYSESIPGYTGHRQEQLNVEPDTQQPGGPRKHIPGYGGYVPGVKSENVFGQTYGKTSFASSAGSFPKGIDQDPHVKFNSVMKGEFIDHSQVAHLHETTAQIVGVSRGQDMYKKPIPPSQVHAFYGSAAPQDTMDEQFKSTSAQDQYNATLRAIKEKPSGLTEEQAQAAFFGVDEVPETKKVKVFEEPIPGYSGVNRRVQADNVFGMTYSEARRMAFQSQNRIEDEKKETLRDTAKYVPEYMRKDATF